MNYRKYIKASIIITSILITIPSVVYIINFWNNSISHNSSDWGTFGDFFGGLINPIVGIANIIFLILISYQIASWDKSRHKDEFIYKVYIEITNTLDTVRLSNLYQIDFVELEHKVVSYRTNNQYLFSDKANIIFNERMSGLQFAVYRLKEASNEEQELTQKSTSVDVSDLTKELLPYLRANAKETHLTRTFKDFETQKLYLIGFLQRLLTHSDFSAFSEDHIIKNDGKDRTVANSKPRSNRENH